MVSLSMAGKGRVGQGWAGHDRTEQNKAGQGRAEAKLTTRVHLAWHREEPGKSGPLFSIARIPSKWGS